MKISCIVPSRNEGVQVIPTLKSLREAGADDIVLIDDSSTDGSCSTPEVKELTDVIVTNKLPRGPSVCRNLGAFAATGDILIFCDCHVRAKPGSLRSFGMTARDNKGWVNASIQPLHPKGPEWTGYGGAFMSDKIGTPATLDAIKTGYRIAYRKVKPEYPVSAVSALIGAFYAIPRSVYFDKLGMWPTTIAYGYNEQGVSMAAYFTDTPMVVDTNMIIQHMFKHTFTYEFDKAWTHINRFLVHFVLFSDDTFRKIWVPKFSQYMKKSRETDPALRMIADPVWQERRARFQRIKKHTDEEFFKMVKDQAFTEVFDANRLEDGQ